MCIRDSSDVVPDVVPELEELPVLSFEEVSDFLLVELSVLLPEVLSVLLPASVPVSYTHLDVYKRQQSV